MSLHHQWSSGEGEGERGREREGEGRREKERVRERDIVNNFNWGLGIVGGSLHRHKSQNTISRSHEKQHAEEQHKQVDRNYASRPDTVPQVAV